MAARDFTCRSPDWGFCCSPQGVMRNLQQQMVLQHLLKHPHLSNIILKSASQADEIKATINRRRQITRLVKPFCVSLGGKKQKT